MAAAYDAGQWHDFAVALGGATGALLGLAFVAMSLNLEEIVRTPTLSGRAAETLVFFAYPLGASAWLLVPALSETALGVGQAVGVLGLALMVAVLGVPRLVDERARPLIWRLWHFLPAVMVAGLAAVGTITTLVSAGGGLYWLAGAMAVSIGMGLLNSWVLLIEIKR